MEQDPERQLRGAVARVVSGKGTPEDEALIKFESVLKGGATKYQPDEFGNVRAVTEPTLYDRIYGASASMPYQPQYPAIEQPQAGAMSVPSGVQPLDTLEGKVPYAPAPMNKPLSVSDLKGVDFAALEKAAMDNAARVNAPAPDMPDTSAFISPADKTVIDETPYGKKERYSADISLQKKRAEKEIDLQSKSKEPLTIEQGKVATFADRMIEADKIIANSSAAQTDLKQKMLSKSPLLPNYLTSENYKKAEQAQRNFINAVLRRESGAVISPEEFENARQQYFPQPGDTDNIVKQKAQNRKTVIGGFTREAGPAYKGQKDSNVINWEDLP